MSSCLTQLLFFVEASAEKRSLGYACGDRPKMLRSLHSNDVGERLAASYVNFYLANGAVILPGFGVPEDEAALRMFEVRAHTRDRVRFRRGKRGRPNECSVEGFPKSSFV